MCHLYIVYYHFLNDYPVFVYSEFPRIIVMMRVGKIRKDVGMDVNKIRDKEVVWQSISQDSTLVFKTVNRLKM